jgi:hypothetical protein
MKSCSKSGLLHFSKLFQVFTPTIEFVDSAQRFTTKKRKKVVTK